MSSCSASMIGGKSKSSKSKSRSSKSRSSKSRSSKSRSSSSKSNSSKSRKQRGGSVLEAAIVPFGLLAVQQWFGTRNVKSSKNKTRKNRK